MARRHVSVSSEMGTETLAGSEAAAGAGFSSRRARGGRLRARGGRRESGARWRGEGLTQLPECHRRRGARADGSAAHAAHRRGGADGGRHTTTGTGTSGVGRERHGRQGLLQHRGVRGSGPRVERSGKRRDPRNRREVRGERAERGPRRCARDPGGNARERHRGGVARGVAFASGTARATCAARGGLSDPEGFTPVTHPGRLQREIRPRRTGR